MSPFGFCHKILKREKVREEEGEREKMPMKGRVIEGLDGLFIRSTR